MKKYICLVERDKTVEKIIRYFKDSEHAFAWLELEGYRVFNIQYLEGEEMNGVTSNGYSQILERIKETPVLLPEGDLTTDELYRWLTGYKDAMDVVTGILEDFIKVDR